MPRSKKNQQDNSIETELEREAKEFIESKPKVSVEKYTLPRHKRNLITTNINSVVQKRNRKFNTVLKSPPKREPIQ